MIPPRRMDFVGGQRYREVGIEFRNLFINFGLKPNDRVLDVGCGIGRMAAPLTSHLLPPGEYEGFDIVKMGIDWCQKNISRRYPHFHFRHSDIRNNRYNSGGMIEAAAYRFPYADGSFNFVFLTSVFTHMLPADMEHYLDEISRVMKKGATSLITFFLLNHESEELIQAKASSVNFTHKLDRCFVADPQNPENATGYPEGYIRDLFSHCGLEIEEPIHYGSWCGRQQFLSYQDIVIAHKR